MNTARSVGPVANLSQFGQSRLFYSANAGRTMNKKVFEQAFAYLSFFCMMMMMMMT